MKQIATSLFLFLSLIGFSQTFSVKCMKDTVICKNAKIPFYCTVSSNLQYYSFVWNINKGVTDTFTKANFTPDSTNSKWFIYFWSIQPLSSRYYRVSITYHGNVVAEDSVYITVIQPPSLSVHYYQPRFSQYMYFNAVPSNGSLYFDDHLIDFKQYITDGFHSIRYKYVDSFGCECDTVFNIYNDEILKVTFNDNSDQLLLELPYLSNQESGTLMVDYIDTRFIAFVPNVFNPNSKVLENSTFRVRGLNIKSCDMQIYDRWGKFVFGGESWNGEGNPSGNYIYKIIVTSTSGLKKYYSGTVTLLY